MTVAEKKKRMADNYAVNSKKYASSRFAKFGRKYKGAFIVVDPVLKAQLTTYVE